MERKVTSDNGDQVVSFMGASPSHQRNQDLRQKHQCPVCSHSYPISVPEEPDNISSTSIYIYIYIRTMLTYSRSASTEASKIGWIDCRFKKRQVDIYEMFTHYHPEWALIKISDVIYQISVQALIVHYSKKYCKKKNNLISITHQSELFC